MRFRLVLPVLGLCLAWQFAAFADDARPNVLFIAIDDMNDWTGFLGGHPRAKTPHMDAFAKRSVNFTNAHCITPACSPCRNALLFGVEPFHSGLYPFYDFRKGTPSELDAYTSLPTHFRGNGYRTFGAGKIHHNDQQFEGEWTDYLKRSRTPLTYQRKKGYQQGDSRKMAFLPTANPLEEHPDHKIASYGIEVLSRSHDKPFFLAVGFHKPHLPFVAPQRFFDLYPDPIEPPSIEPFDLTDVPWTGRAMASIRDDLRFRSDDAWDQVRRSYLACISWTDHNVGRVLDALAESEHADNTIVVLWSDHGYHHGEKRSFRKFSLWEEATRVPFLLHDPRPASKMQPGNCGEAVTLINVYRTLCDLSGITPPGYVDGVSLTPQLRNPAEPVPHPAIITWGRGNYSLRDDDWRYTRYFDGSEELYDHRSDSQEWSNLAGVSEHEEMKRRLSTFLPKREAPLIREYLALWNVVDADKPSLKKTKANWTRINGRIQPPLVKPARQNAE